MTDRYGLLLRRICRAGMEVLEFDDVSQVFPLFDLVYNNGFTFSEPS